MTELPGAEWFYLCSSKVAVLIDNMLLCRYEFLTVDYFVTCMSDCVMVFWPTGVQNPQVIRPRLQVGTGGHVILRGHGAVKSWKITCDEFVRVKQHLGCLLELFNKN